MASVGYGCMWYGASIIAVGVVQKMFAIIRMHAVWPHSSVGSLRPKASKSTREGLKKNKRRLQTKTKPTPDKKTSEGFKQNNPITLQNKRVVSV